MIHINHIRMRAITAKSIYATDIPLKKGLNIIQAHNTSGKSTGMQAIIYALGLERSLGPQLTIPLPYAMRERIHTHKDAPYEPVLQSYIELEIQNADGKSLLVHRDIVGGTDTKLIQTWASGSLSDSANRGEQRDFYVLDAGAAQREDGFHKFLADFMGWTLPIVPRFDGAESPLYLEAIFPMLFVEQKRGWSAIQGPFPTFLKIQDVARRVMEFLLDLDAGKIRRQRSELRAAISLSTQRWIDRRKVVEEQSQQIGRIRGIPSLPSAEFALAPSLRLELFRNDEWRSISDVVKDVSARIAELESEQQHTTEEVIPALEARLGEVRDNVDELGAVLEVIRGEFNSELQEQQNLGVRLKSLNADLLRNQDAAKLKRLGSSLGQAGGEHICPTCHQDVSSELLPAVENVGMGLEENIAFVKSQIELYGTALRGVTERVEDYRARYRSKDEELKQQQSEVRSLRQAMMLPNLAPTRVVIEEIVRLQAFLDRINSFEEIVAIATDEMQRLAAEWVQLTDKLKHLPSDELTSSDDRKIKGYERLLQKQIERYGFVSFQPTEIILSRDNFRPLAITKDENSETVEREIGFEISASDGIRLKWAYYLSMLVLSQTETTNHAGFVIFDEPGQQEIESPSLYAFLQDAAQHSGDRQVIVSTSEPIDQLRAAIGANVNIVSFAGFILQPLAT